jgi:large subunit ribosomal protein L21
MVKINVLPSEGTLVYAVIMTGGKQYRVAEGEVVRVEDLGLEPGSEIDFQEVLLVKTDEKTYIGQPRIEGASVKGVIESLGQGEKVLVFKYKKKKQHRRTRGHRQHYADVRIGKIHISG